MVYSWVDHVMVEASLFHRTPVEFPLQKLVEFTEKVEISENDYYLIWSKSTQKFRENMSEELI